MDKGQIIALKGMYQDYFLDYASYVILERAVPKALDGLKPVQRRILHAMKEMDDGRYHKVANIIGQTMQYHPHGDAAIGDALVNLGQKDLLIDCQGNWGDVRTGDSAAAPRYIEARLTKFALEVAFNPQTTDWQLTYDGRKKEPIQLPMKFPMILATGVEGIAVGLSTKILPHNFIELIKASIKLLQGKSTQLYPDFQTGGMIDVSDYRDGHRGGKVKVRAKIEILDKKTLVVRELPYGVSTVDLIDSIVKATDKGKIKIKKVQDNTAKDVEILIELIPGTSPEVTMDALYAFTSCEESISPNACVIIDDKPHFLTIEELLKISTDSTKALLQQELLIKKGELDEKWLFASLEKIFIEQRIYRDIEESETFEAALIAIEAALRQFVATPNDTKPNEKRLKLWRDITQDDVMKLTEIRIKRISKYNTFEANERIEGLEKELTQVEYDLNHLTQFAIAYFEQLLKKYGKGRERRTEITVFDAIQATEVVANNAKLYANLQEGFIGFGLKKGEGDFICDCSDIDDVIVFRKDGKFIVTRIDSKKFVGKDILHVSIWKKGDERTTYNVAYLDGESGKVFVKRFNVSAITRDREYDISRGTVGSKLLYFSINPNGESEIVTVQLSQGSKAKIKSFDYDFADIDIKGRAAQGNILTRYPIRKIVQKERGQSTLGALRLYMDEVSGRLNTDERGLFLGTFDTGDSILVLYKDGSYEMTDFELSNRYDPNEIWYIGKHKLDQVVSAVYYDGHKEWTMVKRFQIETTTKGQRFSFITDHKESKCYFATLDPEPRIKYAMRIKGQRIEGELELTTFIEVKGWKAAGNKLSDQKLMKVEALEVYVEEDGQTKLFE